MSFAATLSSGEDGSWMIGVFKMTIRNTSGLGYCLPLVSRLIVRPLFLLWLQAYSKGLVFPLHEWRHVELKASTRALGQLRYLVKVVSD